MAKKTQKGTKGQKAVSPKVEKLYISRRFLGEFYGLDGSKLLFAVSELSCGDAEVQITPIIAICGCDTYIDLNSGDNKKIANAAGFKQDLYPAIVKYDAEEEKFIFKSSVQSKAEISVSTLQNIYGKSIVSGHII